MKIIPVGTKVISTGYTEEERNQFERAQRGFIQRYSVTESLLIAMNKLAKFILPAVLVALMVLASSSGVLASTELAYDDGSRDDWDYCADGDYLAVLFSLPDGWSSARLLKARFYKVRESPGTDVKVHIFGSDGSTPLTPAFTFDIAVEEAWNDADLTAKNIVVTGDFYIAIQWISYKDPWIGVDDSTTGRSYYSDDVSPPSWQLRGNAENVQYMIRAVIDPVHAVGGILHSVDKLALLSPYLALVGLAGVVTVAAATTRRRKT